MLQNIQDFKNNTGDEETKFKRAFVEGKLGGVEVKVGRYDAFFADGNIYDAEADGVELAYGDKVKITGFAGKATDGEAETLAGETIDSTYGTYVGAEIGAELGSVNAKVGYFKYKDMFENSDAVGKGMENKLWYLGADYTLGDVNLAAMFNVI